MISSIGIVSHLNRMNAAYDTAHRVGASVVSVDDHSLGCAGNHIVTLAALRRYSRGDSWCVVLEDDAVPVAQFRQNLERALARASDPVVGLYLGTGNNLEVQAAISSAMLEADERKLAWLRADFLMNGVGYAIHSRYVYEILDFIVDRDDEEFPLRITRWLQANELHAQYAYPSLVDHADVPSIVAPEANIPPRKAWVVGVRSDYETDTATLGWCPIWSAPDAQIPQEARRDRSATADHQQHR